MLPPKEFREFALDCLHRADEATEKRNRQMLLDMAAHWMRAAVQLEKTIIAIDNEASLIPKDHP